MCIANMPPTIIGTDNPNDIIEKGSNNTSTVNVNIIKDESYTGKSNNYYDKIDNKILQTEYEGTIMYEGVEDAEEPNTKNVTTANNTNNITNKFTIITTNNTTALPSYLQKKKKMIFYP